jgi:hypothetical protein
MKIFFIPLSFLILLIFSIASGGAELGIPKDSRMGTPQSQKTPLPSVPKSGKKNGSENYSSGAISIYLSSIGRLTHPPCSLLIENPEGLKTGYDPIKGLYYNEIPKSVYETTAGINSHKHPIPVDQIPKTVLLDISEPSNGVYNLYVTASDKGRYALEFHIFESEMDSSFKSFNDISITPGEIHIYYLNYLNNTKDGTDIYFIGNDKHSKSMNKIEGTSGTSHK